MIVPNTKSQFILDVKYADYSTVFDTYESPGAECYVIPPYKPYMYVMVSGGGMKIYSLKGKNEHS